MICLLVYMLIMAVDLDAAVTTTACLAQTSILKSQFIPLESLTLTQESLHETSSLSLRRLELQIQNKDQTVREAFA